MDAKELKNLVECLLFVAESPLSVREISKVVEKVDLEDITIALVELQEDYTNRGISIMELGGGYQMRTLDNYAPWVRRLLEIEEESKLSRAALETLAIIAYKQPIIKSEVDAIRGVRSESSIQKLLDKNLITVVGRKEGVGRPLLYGTTRHFLTSFGLRDLSELPKVEDMKEILEQPNR